METIRELKHIKNYKYRLATIVNYSLDITLPPRLNTNTPFSFVSELMSINQLINELSNGYDELELRLLQNEMYYIPK